MQGSRRFGKISVKIYGDQFFPGKKKLLEFGTARIGKSRSERGRKCVQKIQENLKKNYFVAREVFGDVFSGVRVCLVVQAQAGELWCRGSWVRIRPGVEKNRKF